MRLPKGRSSRVLFLSAVAAFQGISLYVAIVRPTSEILPSLVPLYDHATDAKAHAGNRQVDELVRDLSNLNNDLSLIGEPLGNMKVLSFFPVVGPLYRQKDQLLAIAQDALDIHGSLLQEISPYADALGITSGGGQEQYLEKFIKASPQVIPIIDAYLTEVSPLLKKITALNVSAFSNNPFPIRDYGEQVVSSALVIQENLPQITTLVTQLPRVMGVDTPQNYQILFQNDKELRPTGGFITSFTTVVIDRGEISFTDARDIYQIDESAVYYPSPRPILAYLTERVWHLRDANFSPDFKDSMEFFHTYWQQVGQKPFDGILAIDTQFVEALLAYTGDIEVQGYDIDFSAYPGVPESCRIGGNVFTHENVVCRLEFYAERAGLPYEQRKDVIGLLMHKLFDEIMSSESSRWEDLSQVFLSQLNEKHLLLYFTDPVIQSIAEKYNFAGRVKDTDGDYFLVNDANLAGLKSDMYLKRSVDQEYEVDADGTITKTVTIAYENTGSFDGWLNATARNYTRLYVPKGSRLIASSGGDAITSTFDDLGKTVFDNFVRIPPLSTSTVEFVYELPFKRDGDLLLLIQKQPGKEVEYHRIFVDETEEFTLDVYVDEERTVPL